MQQVTAVQSDAIALILIGIMVFYGNLQERNWRERSIFTYMLLVNGIMCSADIAAWILERMIFPGSGWLLQLSSFTYNGTMTMIGVFWLFYCDQQVMENRKNYKKRQLLYIAPAMASLILHIINIKTGWIFYYDEANVYHRGELYVIHITLASLYFALATGIVFVAAGKRNGARAKEAYGLLGFLIAPALGIIFQTMYYGISMIPFGITISMLIIFLQKIIAMITKDDLTGLDNHRSFEKQLEEKVRNVTEDQKLFVMMVDANFFKSINDTYGHDTGDEALVQIAQALRCACDDKDYIARIGGDEFVVIGLREKEKEVERLCDRISAEMEVRNSRLPYELSVSTGYDIFEQKKHKDGTALYKSADEKMYEHKRQFHESKTR